MGREREVAHSLQTLKYLGLLLRMHRYWYVRSHCKNKVVMLAKYLVTTVTWLSLLWKFYECRAGKGADTWVILQFVSNTKSKSLKPLNLSSLSACSHGNRSVVKTTNLFCSVWVSILVCHTRQGRKFSNALSSRLRTQWPEWSMPNPKRCVRFIFLSMCR